MNLLFAVPGYTVEGILVFLLVLCVMVTIHEFGHFIVAKWLGIPAEVFSVGFGKRLFGFDWGGTDFRISLLPLGGYVKFRGENLEMIQGKSEGSVDEFLAHAGWKRFLVALAGPVFNIITAILIPTIGIMIGFNMRPVSNQETIVASVVAGQPAEKAGLQPGDKIVSVNGVKNPTFDDFKMEISLRPGEEIPLIIERGGQQIPKTVVPVADGDQKEGRIGVVPDMAIKDLKVVKVTPDSAAAKAGIQVNDRLVSINGQPLVAQSRFQQVVKEINDKEVTLGINRAGQPIQIKATPHATKDDPFGLGADLSDAVFTKEKNPLAALAFGWNFNMKFFNANVVAFKQIFTGKRSARDSLAGPIGMAKLTSGVFKDGGWAGVIQMMGFLSLSLGVMNLLPIPVLDGGMILMIFIEGLLGLIGKTVSMAMRERYQQVGFVALMLLMGFVFFNDFARDWPFGKSSEPAPAVQASPAPQPGK